MYRGAVAYLWRFSRVRLFVIWYVMRRAPGYAWLAVNTPLLYCLKDLFLKLDNPAAAADVCRYLRSVGEL